MDGSVRLLLDLGLGQVSRSSPISRGHGAPVLFQPVWLAPLEGSRARSWQGAWLWPQLGHEGPLGPSEGLLGFWLPARPAGPLCQGPFAQLPSAGHRPQLAAQDFVPSTFRVYELPGSPGVFPTWKSFSHYCNDWKVLSSGESRQGCTVCRLVRERLLPAPVERALLRRALWVASGQAAGRIGYGGLGVPAGPGLRAWGLQVLWSEVGPPMASWCVRGVAGQSDRTERG